MPASVRETALAALHGLLAAAAWPAPAPEVVRGEPEADDIPPGGRVVLVDGEPGEAEEYLSPPTYAYAHRAEIVVAVQHRDPATRAARLDALLRALGEVLASDPTLGGAVDMATSEAPEPADETTEGAVAVKAARVPVILDYVTNNPLS